MITPENALETIAKIGTSIETAYIFLAIQYWALGCTKLSILFFYRRIFRGKVFNVITWIVIVLVSLWTLIFGLVWIFSCGAHPPLLWTEFSEISSHCLNIFDQMMAGAVVDWVFDIFIIALPCTMVWQLQMPLRQKLYVCGIFLTGILSFIAGILRFTVTIALADFGNSAISAGDYSSLSIASMASKTLGVSKADWLGMSTVSLFWSMIEISIALIAVNLPALHAGAAIKNSNLYKWLSGWSSRLSIRYSKGSTGSSRSGGDRKKSSGSSMSTPIKAPWQSLATGTRSQSDSDRSDLGNAKAIYYDQQYQVTESVHHIPMEEGDFRRRYEELFPPGSFQVYQSQDGRAREQSIV
ncbi:MAG: hypothetical protein M1820_007252 [Bogoriella megaspora]|nr:MAG: hypothetical protein M1820_007252 [Bogoriella megaspora]